MSKRMNKDKAIELLKTIKEEDDIKYCNFKEQYYKALDHAINCVGAIEQIKWERDIAIQQLNELGLELGQKTDEVQRAIQHFNNLKKIAKGSDEE